MAKGLLFALVRKGSKLNYLDEGNNQCDQSERKQSNEKCKSHSKVNSQNGVIENAERYRVFRKSSEQFKTTTEKTEGKRRRRKLFDLTLQKLSKGCKNSPACVNNGISTQGTAKQRDTPKSGHLGKATVVPSVASGYFVHETSNNNRKEVTIKMQENGSLIPRIAVTDHDMGYSTPSKTVETNRPRIHYSRYSSLPQLRIDERRKRPWTEDESSSQFKSFTNRKASAESQISKVEAEPSNISGLFIEAIPISTSPSISRRNLGSANSFRSQCSQRNTSDVISDTFLERCWKGDSSLTIDTKSCVIKRASSWSRGDEKTLVLTDERQNSRKINIFLPTL